MKGIIGKKVGMTQIFDDNGNVIPVTVIQAGPCYVTQVRSSDRDGYVAVQRRQAVRCPGARSAARCWP